MPWNPSVLVGFVSGLLVGALHFSGLWATVRRLPLVRRPHSVALGSFLIRTTLSAALLALVAIGSVPGLLAGVVGFLGARVCAVRFLPSGGLTRQPRWS